MAVVGVPRYLTDILSVDTKAKRPELLTVFSSDGAGSASSSSTTLFHSVGDHRDASRIGSTAVAAGDAVSASCSWFATISLSKQDQNKLLGKKKVEKFTESRGDDALATNADPDPTLERREAREGEFDQCGAYREANRTGSEIACGCGWGGEGQGRDEA